LEYLSIAIRPTYEELEQRVKELEQSEEELQESEERFRALSEASFEAIFLSENGICFEQNQTEQTSVCSESNTIKETYERKYQWIVR
jgi:PAS domain-containing protein